MTPKTRIEQEISQTKPFASSAVVPLIALLRTANLVERQYNALLEPFDLTLQQFNVLSILRGAEPHGHPVQEIGSRMIAVSPGVTRLVDKLVARRLVVRVPGVADRRQVICRITPAGLALLSRIDAPLLALDDALMTPVLEAERELLVELLDRIRAPLLPEPLPQPEELSP
jgi:DNA-binding MarR family transcriptional regulator